MGRVYVVTGAAGFIGSAVSQRLLERGDAVIGIDNMTDYYDTQLKEARLRRLRNHARFLFHRLCVCNAPAINDVFGHYKPSHVVHLAAQVGVRFSLESPATYLTTNVTGFGVILEACRQYGIEHLCYASSSSVYGKALSSASSERDDTDRPVSLYAATKKANELMAHAYSHLYGLPTTGLRFFTVYGPWGRPDMAYFKFVRAILDRQPINVYNRGEHMRDFTYIDDVATAVVKSSDLTPGACGSDTEAAHGNSDKLPYRILNIGKHEPVPLMRLIELIERALGLRARKQLIAAQPGDVLDTCADLTNLASTLDYVPGTTLEVGIQRFVEWYREYYTCPIASLG